jgi:Novel STAND NTPase 1
MMHFTYPNAQRGQFQACVRFLSLPPAQAPDLPYEVADPRTPNKTDVFMAVEELVPERQEQVVQGTAAQVYEIADVPGPWQGASLDFAYLLALIRCSRPCILEALADAGDVWCTGELRMVEGRPMLRMVEQPSFDAKLTGFLAQPHDRLFLVPAANFTSTHTDLCHQHQVRVLTLAAFREALPAALASGSWPAPGVVLVGTYELPLLSATLFQPAPARAPHQWSRGAGAPRRPYKFLDPFGLTDTGLFCRRDQEIAQLQRQFHATRLLILYGESGTGKTSLIQAGLLPSLPVERYAWVLGPHGPRGAHRGNQGGPRP